MIIDTFRFGSIEIDENKIIYFHEGLPGLEEYKHFAILQFNGSYPIIWLQSIDDGEICLPVIDSFLAKPEYSFDISDDDVNRLSLIGPEELKIISVLVIPDNMEHMTINLAAPIIINTRNGQARQVILNSDEYSARVPIYKDVMRLIKGGDANAGAVKEAK